MPWCLQHCCGCCRCGPSLAAVLQGQQDPLELLFPGGNMDSAESVYAEAPTMKFYNRLVAAAVQALLLDAQMKNYFSKFMEIGGGTGATTGGILPLIQTGCAEYWFTDLSDTFLNRAQQRWQKK